MSFSFNNILDGVVTTLQSNTDLVTLCAGDPTNIYAYKWNLGKNSNIEEARLDQELATCMVYARGIRTGIFADKDTLKYDVGVSIRPLVDVADMFQALREGICSTTGQKFKLIQVTPDVRPPEDLSLNLQTVIIASQNMMKDIADVFFSLTYRGIDN